MAEEKNPAELMKQIGYMNEEQIAQVLSAVSKRASQLNKDKTSGIQKRTLAVLKKATRLNHPQLVFVEKMMEASHDADEQSMKYIIGHFDALKSGSAVRVAKVDYPWLKDTMIQFSRASQQTSDFLRFVMSLSEEKRAKMPEIMNNYAAINELLMGIIKMTKNSRPKRSVQSLRNTKAKKSGTQGRPNKSKAETPDVKTEVKKVPETEKLETKIEEKAAG